MHIFFSVGEPSGDQHAAHLIQELRRCRPDLTVSGFGGPLMQSAGCSLLYRLTDLAVMGFLRVIPLLRKFIRLVGAAENYFKTTRPDAVVLVDFPGFNWWIARKAKAAGIPVFYYLPPQLWAWAPWRVRRMKKFVDYVLCGLPFEKAWYAERGVEAHYVGHPFFDEVADHSLDGPFCKSRLIPGVRNVGVLPGSRNAEIEQNWPMMIEIMRQVSAQHENVRFLVANYKQAHLDRCREMVEASATSPPVEFYVGNTPEIIEISECCLMVSGSVSLEMLARRKPALIIYRLSRLLRALAPLVLCKLQAISLPNVMAGRHVMPEWLISWRPKRDVRQVVETLNAWITDSAQLSEVEQDISELHEHVVKPGASARTAEAILSRLPAESSSKAA